MGASQVCRRFPGWSRARVRPAGGTHARRCRGEDRWSGSLNDGADQVLLPERARGVVSLMRVAARERRCRTWDAVTVARTAALRAPHRGDGAGARAVAT
jgi:hypothetical protein